MLGYFLWYFVMKTGKDELWKLLHDGRGIVTPNGEGEQISGDIKFRVTKRERISLFSIASCRLSTLVI